MLNLIIHSTLIMACPLIASAAPSSKDVSQKAEGHPLLTFPIVSGIYSLFSFFLMIMKGEWISGTNCQKTGWERIQLIRQDSSEGLNGYVATHLLTIPDPQPDRLPFDTPDRGYWPPS